MAVKKRFNMAFVWGTAVAVGLGGGGVLAWYKFRTKDPAIFENAADEALKRGDFDTFVHAMQMVEQLKPTEPAPHLKVAKAYYDRKDQDVGSNLTSAIDEYTKAEERKPDSLEAWKGLLKANKAYAVWLTQSLGQTNDKDVQVKLPDRIRIARDAAQHVLKLDPKDSDGRAAVPELLIQLWLQKFTLPEGTDGQTDTQQIDAAVAELTGCMRDHPDDADLPYFIARAKIEQAVRLIAANGGVVPAGAAAPAGPMPGTDPGSVAAATAGVGTEPATAGTPQPANGGGGLAALGDRPTDVRSLFGEAAVVFDESIRRQPDNATLQFRKFQILSLLMTVDPIPDDIPVYQKAQRAALDQAQAKVGTADPSQYTLYKSTWAELVSQNDPGRAEAVYLDLLAHPAPVRAVPGVRRPATLPAGTPAPLETQADVEHLLNEIAVRERYALMLGRDAGRRRDALNVLAPLPDAAPLTLSPNLRPPLAYNLATVHLRRAQLLTDLLDGAGLASTESADRLSRAKAEIAAAASYKPMADSVEVLLARGRLQLVSGEYRDAITTLSAARDRAQSGHQGIGFDLLYMLAQALDKGEQPGEAARLLEQTLANGAGNNRQVRSMLADLYIRQQAYDKAHEQVTWLAERYPDEVEVILLQLRAMGPNPDPAAVTPLYHRIPEQTNDELVIKSNYADLYKMTPEVERLLYAMLNNRQADPNRRADPYITMRLAQVLARDHKLAEANTALDAAIAAHPDAAEPLNLVRIQLNGNPTAGELKPIQDEIVKGIKDPFNRHMAEYRLAQSRGDLPGQITAITDALAVQPQNKEALKTLFACLMAAKQFDQVDALVPRLAAADVDDAHGDICRCQLAMARGDKQAALTLARKLTHDLPQFATTWEMLGEAQEADGQFDAACQQYIAVLDRQANNPTAMAHLVDCLIRLGKLDDARDRLKEARRRFPDDAQYREQQVHVEVAFGDPELVLPIVDDEVKRHPELPRSWQTAAQTYMAAAQRRAGTGDADGAAKYTAHVRDLLAGALEKSPDNLMFAGMLAELQSQDRSKDGVAAAAATLDKVRQQPKWKADPAAPDLLLGRMYMTARQPAMALDPLRQAVAGHADFVEARTLLADALVAAGKPQEALDVLSLDRADPVVRVHYADLMLRQKRAPEVVAELTAQLKDHPADAAAANLLAHVYAAQGNWDAALSTIAAVLAADPKDTDAYLVRGTILASRPGPDLDGATRDLDQFTKAYPGNLQGRLTYAAVLSAKHDVEGATRELEGAVDAAPDNKEARLRLTAAYLAAAPRRVADARRVMSQSLAMPALAHDPDVQRSAAEVWLAAGDPDRAVTSIRDAMANAPDQRAMLNQYFAILLQAKQYQLLLDESNKFIADPHAATWVVYDFRGQAKARTGDPNGAYDDFQSALNLAGAAPASGGTPSAGPALVVTGHLTDQLGVETAVRMVAGRAQNSTLWKMVLANCYDRAGDSPRAIAAAEAALADADGLNPADRRTMTRMTATLYILAQPPQGEKALPMFQSLLRDDPDDIDALNNVAYVLSELVSPPRPQEAMTYSDRAVAAAQRSGQSLPAITDTHGWLLIQTGQTAAGMDELHRAVDQAGSPGLPDAHYHLAMAYLRQTPPQPGTAKTELNTATHIISDADPAHKLTYQPLISKIEAAQKQADDLDLRAANN